MPKKGYSKKTSSADPKGDADQNPTPPQIGDFSAAWQWLADNPIIPTPIRDLPFVSPISATHPAPKVIAPDEEAHWSLDRSPTSSGEGRGAALPSPPAEDSDNDYVVGPIDLGDLPPRTTRGPSRRADTKKVRSKTPRKVTSSHRLAVSDGEQSHPMYKILARPKSPAHSTNTKPVKPKDDKKKPPTLAAANPTQDKELLALMTSLLNLMPQRSQATGTSTSTALGASYAAPAPLQAGKSPTLPAKVVTFADPTTRKSHRPPSHPWISRSIVEQDWAFRIKLVQSFPEDQLSLVRKVTPSRHHVSNSGIHVFIDYSNIWIGYLQRLEPILGDRNLFRNMHFEALVFFLERGRPTSKRTLVGSLPRLPAFDTADEIGYETNLFARVKKPVPERQNRNASDQTSGATPPSSSKLARRVSLRGTREPQSGSSPSKSPYNWTSGPETLALTAPTPSKDSTRPSPEKWREQGVDEILQLRMFESLVDSDEPSTIVLATGDGALGEYSQGFHKMLDRMLARGWKVELVSWSNQLSSAYRNQSWLQRWKGQFRYLPLDDWAEFLIELPYPTA
jgi:hypothetical protein